jgi:hypothetical protein
LNPDLGLTRRLGLQKRCLGILAALFWCLSCTVPQVRISPPPSQIKRVEGYASLKTSSQQGSSRAKFSFLFQLPHQGRIDVSHVLGKTLYQIIIHEEEAFFLVPSKRVYWQGEEQEIIHRFLGFELNLQELFSLFSGQWKRLEEDDSGIYGREEWILERDDKGKVRRGNRGELTFEVVEFFKNTDVVRRLAFRHPLTQGRIVILQLRFNEPLKKEVFSLHFLKSFQLKTWEEIQEMLDKKRP